MPRTFLVYWLPDQMLASLEEGSLPHAAGAQLKRISVTDRLWVCGRTHDSAELFVIGYLDVHEKLSQASAQAEMSRRARGYRVWDAPWHVLAEQGAECITRQVSLRPLYASLRFDSKDSPRLSLDESGHPNAQQLQTIRRLTSASADSLWKLWSSSIRSS